MAGGVFLFLYIYSFVKDLFLYCNTFLQKRSSRHMYYRLSSFLDLRRSAIVQAEKSITQDVNITTCR